MPRNPKSLENGSAQGRQEEAIEKTLEALLLERHGPMITGTALSQALGYPTDDALRKALARGTVPIPVFSIPKRRGKFALTTDVARWLAEQRATVSQQQTGEE